MVGTRDNISDQIRQWGIHLYLYKIIKLLWQQFQRLLNWNFQDLEVEIPQGGFTRLTNSSNCMELLQIRKFY